MDQGGCLITIVILTLLSVSFLSDVQSATFRIVNKCRYTVWPGLLSGAGTSQLPTTGFLLKSGKSRTVAVPRYWSGRMWGRTLCSRDSSGRLSCLSADCGSGRTQCAGGGAKPPATLAEFTLNGAGGLDFYDVSLVDGYNVPMLIVPKGGGGGGDCSATGCLVDLNGACPAELRVARGNNSRALGCRSACEALGDPRYCCSEAYATPDVCGPSAYSQFFKHACPRAYSYAYDDKTSTFTCAGADYIIVFCPAPYTSQKLLGAQRKASELPLVNKSTIYLASHHGNHGSPTGSASVQAMVFVVSFVGAIMGSWQRSLPCNTNLGSIAGAIIEIGSGLLGRVVFLCASFFICQQSENFQNAQETSTEMGVQPCWKLVTIEPEALEP